MAATHRTLTNSRSGGHDTNSKEDGCAKPAARKSAAAKRTRKPRAVHPMTPAIRDLGAAVVGYATERAMASENLGIAGTRSRELPGKRTGLATVLTLDDGTRITFTMVVR